jgi:hypothetical protein
MRSQPLIVGFNLRFNSTQPHRSRPVIEGARLRFNSAQQRIKVDLAVDERCGAEKVAAAEYRLTLDLLQLSQLAAARLDIRYATTPLADYDSSSVRGECHSVPVFYSTTVRVSRQRTIRNSIFGQQVGCDHRRSRFGTRSL